MKTPQLSVIIPFFNGASTLKETVRALLEQTPATRSMEILLVDDGSADGGFPTANLPANVRVIRQENRGPAAARNRGVAESQAEIILFIDADCVPDANWAEALARCLEANPQASGAKGIYRSEQASLTARFVQLEYQTKYRYMSRFPTIDFVDTYCAAFRRKVFENAQYDETFPKASVEDQEFSFRLVSQGHSFVFCPQARVRHLHAASPAAYLRKKMKIGYWKAKILVAQKRRFLGDTHTPKTLRLEMLLLPLLLIGAVGASLGSIPFVWGFCATGIAFILCGAPLFREAARHDRALLLFVPLFTFLRAFGLTLGLAAGLATFGGRRLQGPVLPSCKS